MAIDNTVRILDSFYDLNLAVNASEYEVVYSFFNGFASSPAIAKSFTEILFRISNLTDISVIDLLNSFQGSDELKTSLTLAYYLNSVSNKTVLYGVNNVLTPNQLVSRNIIPDSATDPYTP